MDRKGRRGAERIERLGELVDKGGRGGAEQDVRRPAGIQKRAEDVEDGALAAGREHLADGRDPLESRMPRRRKVKGVAERGKGAPQLFGRRIQPDSHGGEQVRAPAF
jgi:hypothetical protein